MSRLPLSTPAHETYEREPVSYESDSIRSLFGISGELERLVETGHARPIEHPLITPLEPLPPPHNAGPSLQNPHEDVIWYHAYQHKHKGVRRRGEPPIDLGWFIVRVPTQEEADALNERARTEIATYEQQRELLAAQGDREPIPLPSNIPPLPTPEDSDALFGLEQALTKLGFPDGTYRITPNTGYEETFVRFPNGETIPYKEYERYIAAQPSGPELDFSLGRDRDDDVSLQVIVRPTYHRWSGDLL